MTTQRTLTFNTEMHAISLIRGPIPTEGDGSFEGIIVATNRPVGDGSIDLTSAGHDFTVESDDQIIELHLEDSGMVAENGPFWLLIRRHQSVRSARILVIEDNQANADYYKDVLTNAGAAVEVAHTASDGLKLARKGEYQLALVDVRLPDANGYEVCRLLGSLDSGWTAPTLLMSADPSVLEPARVKAVGASGFVANPVRPKVLAETAAYALSREPLPSHIALDDRSAPADQQILVRLFGIPAVASPEGWHELAGRSANVLSTLAAKAPQPVSADRLSSLVWDQNLTVSSNAMYTAISRLRRHLEPTYLAGAVMTEGNGYRLDIKPEQVDLVAFERNAQRFLNSKNDATINELSELLDTWHSDPFPGTSNELLSNWHNRLSELRAQAQELLAVKLIADGRAAEALQRCRDLVVEEPWRESTWSLLIISFYRAGQPNEALLAFRMAKAQLRDDLGLDPGPGLTRLEQMVLSHDKRLLDDTWVQQTATSLNTNDR